jgi:hypothetical protein
MHTFDVTLTTLQSRQLRCDYADGNRADPVIVLGQREVAAKNR